MTLHHDSTSKNNSPQRRKSAKVKRPHKSRRARKLATARLGRCRDVNRADFLLYLYQALEEGTETVEALGRQISIREIIAFTEGLPK